MIGPKTLFFSHTQLDATTCLFVLATCFKGYKLCVCVCELSAGVCWLGLMNAVVVMHVSVFLHESHG